MDEDDIKALFEKVSKHFEGADDGSRAMFSMLVSVTLRYRDQLIHASGQPLTVAETREALNAFMQVLKTHAIPAGLTKRAHGLVVLWLEELHKKVHN